MSFSFIVYFNKSIACLLLVSRVVLKTDDHDITSSSIRKLDAEGRMYEIARLLGGSNISETALANARELLNVQATTDL